MSTDTEASVNLWLARLKRGEPDAAGPLWDLYFTRLVRLARKSLRARRPTLADEDEEDIALLAFLDLCDGARRGSFPHLDDRRDLWRVLIHLTVCRARDRRKRASAARRGAGLVVREADFRPDPDRAPRSWSLDHLVAADPDPQSACLLAEAFDRRLDDLADPTLRLIARMKLEGHTHDEIRAALGCSLRTVTLKLHLIRELWHDLPP
jgi:DNA-directed RNA polymerase specialized sigma24 family protein